MIQTAVISLACAIALAGCGTSGPMRPAGPTPGIEQTLSGITYKTFTAPLPAVRAATVASLKNMHMTLTEDTAIEDGWKIAAAAGQRKIGIELERVTTNTTRMRVVADNGDFFFKDSATATEIILQTAQTVDDGRAPGTLQAGASRAPARPSAANGL